MVVYVLDPSLDVVGIISNFSALTHTRECAGSGSFKLEIPYTTEVYNLLQMDRILYWVDCGKQNAVYIDTVICERSNDEQIITASGKNIRGFLGRRIVWDNVAYSGTVEGFARKVVQDAFIAPTDATRKVPNLVLGNSNGLSERITTITENDNVEELLDSVSQETGIVFDLVLDLQTKLIQFVCRKGTDRRTTQSTNPHLIISQERNNALSDAYTKSDEPYCNTALIGGYQDKDTGARYTTFITSKSGLDRREIYVSGPSSEPKADEEAGITLEQAIQTHKLELLQKGREELAEQVSVREIEVEASGDLTSQIDVGDFVTVKGTIYGIAQTYVNTITAYYEGGGKRYDIAFGDITPTFTARIKRQLKRWKRSVR